MGAWTREITEEDVETGGSRCSAHVLDYVGFFEIAFDQLPSKDQ